jgi:hypothetical protein
MLSEPSDCGARDGQLRERGNLSAGNEQSEVREHPIAFVNATTCGGIPKTGGGGPTWSCAPNEVEDLHPELREATERALASWC